MKQCTRCHKEHPRTSEFFSPCKTARDKLNWVCRPCHRKWDNKRYHSLDPQERAFKVVFQNAKRRCQNKNDTAFKDYGGRGIKFLFQSIEELKEVLGPRPDGMTIDRIDSNGHYEKTNVRWATILQQNRNKRNVKLNPAKVKEIRSNFNSGGITKRALSKIYGCSEGMICQVIKGNFWKEETL